MPVILVVDDNPDIAGVIQEMVRLGGYQTEVAYSGLEGLDKAREGMPDLILVDVMMPEMDGWEVYHRLREFSSIPVIFVTNHKKPEYEARASELGAAGFLIKEEFTPIELAQQIHFVLADQGGAGNRPAREYLH